MTDRYADLSVVIPTYDRPVLIRETIDSVLAQVLPPREIILVNNGPHQDAYRELAASYGDKVTYLRSDPPGTQGARNTGLNHATSSWVAFLDDDDLWTPDFLSVAAPLLDDPGISIIGADHIKMEEGRLQAQSNFDLAPQRYWEGIRPAGEADAGIVFRVGKFPLDRLVKRIPFYPSSLLLRRDLVRAIGGFDLRLTGYVTEDIEFLVRALTSGSLAIIWKPMMHYRLHASSYSRGKRRQVVGRWRIFEYIHAHAEFDAKFRELLSRDLPTRRAKVFDVAFAIGDFDAMTDAWPGLRPKDRTWRRRLRRMIAAFPSPAREVLNKALVALRPEAERD